MSSSKERILSDGRLDFSQRLLENAIGDKPKYDFLSDLLRLVLKYSSCDSVEIWLKESGQALRCEVIRLTDETCDFRIISEAGNKAGAGNDCPEKVSGMETLCISMLNASAEAMPFACTRYGSFRISDTLKPLSQNIPSACQPLYEDLAIESRYRSLAVIPLRFGMERIGLLIFKNKRRDTYDDSRIEYLETVAAKFELALLHHQSQAKLLERVKELTCLYGISQTASDPDKTFEHKLMDIVSLLPPAWQYPDQASARIIVDGNEFKTQGFQEGDHLQSSQIRVKDKRRGMVEVHYSGVQLFQQGNPFLEEEQSLINNIAGQIALMIEHREAEAIRYELQNQLIRADRLAAIGQLAAGVAHELNEPLNTILGFAQLVQKATEMNAQTMADIQKITDASLHARKIIRELLVFARQAKSSRTKVNLNRIVEEELSLFESLCKKSGVELKRVLEPCLPEIVADKSQMLQVLSNLLVNALHAMPDGGELMIRTGFDQAHVFLDVLDTGIGMNDETRENIFVPFFTTKDVDQGTGLGLAVVHGIVASHGGEISVESMEGQGTQFKIRLPRRKDVVEEEAQEDDGL